MAILIPQEDCTARPLASTVLRFEDRWIAQSLNLTNFYFVSAVGDRQSSPRNTSDLSQPGGLNTLCCSLWVTRSSELLSDVVGGPLVH
jgi:hypothetical protein